MNKYAVITDGTVQNVANADPEFASEQGWIAAPAHVGPGWGYDGTNWTPPQEPEPASEDVNKERNRRISGGFSWNGHTFQSDPDSRENIIGSSVDATEFMRSGGSSDEVYWQSPDTPFVWLSEENQLVPLSPAQMIDMGRALLSHKKNCIFAARVLKDMDPIPSDFTDDKYWP
tara:strand:- start:2297 stop:2815 length:519 start_codon:yes stop_codon:yes gene_type:complete